MNFADAFNTWIKERNTAKQLSRLSDRNLEDLGITRGNIDKAARRAVRKGSFYL